MPTKKKRINISFDDDTYQCIEALAAAAGTTRSGVVSEMMREATPQLLSITKSLLFAKEKNLDAFEQLEAAILKNISQSAQVGLEITKKKVALRRSHDKP